MSGPWQKSSFSTNNGNGDCVELTAVPGGIALREGDRPADVLITAPPRLAALLTAVKAAATGTRAGH
ncbi:DUF397 domain-containing protein [Streptomyces aidingensis]|uniref:DUF397 domain-containing protein n=1 Tax=Streptomyces aidingensis TaxID=910347 RepID=A0A1I1PZU7_9ACTN|nr:DUF397 domain-containing protein [Streptomyces aidingensis]SFD15192.1 protein of unknown function [Streptomyces aidingensis]